MLLFSYDGKTQVAALEPRTEAIVGRSSEATVEIDDGRLSRLHAAFWLDDEGVWVRDLGSTNGTQVNGRSVNEHRLGARDRVTVGGTTVTLHVPEKDPVGEIESYHAFTRAIEELVFNASRSGGSVALAMARGDLTLGRNDLPRDAVVGRHGQGTTAILLPRTSDLDLQAVTERFRALAAQPEALRIGLASYPQSAESADALQEAALAALQHADAHTPICWAPRRDTVSRLDVGQTLDRVVIHSAAMRMLWDSAKQVASSKLPVLLHGETGVGKEVIAQMIHRESPRGKAPMVCLNCGAITESLITSQLFGHAKGAFTGADRRAKGVFEEADGGTVFLDEIGELPASVQASLLRVLETGAVVPVGETTPVRVDVRLITATHRDLEQMVEERRFRADLLFRLNTMVLTIPPLRERREEIPLLVLQFLRQANKTNNCQVSSLAPEVLPLLKQYDWPGNVRELRNTIERAAVLARRGEIGIQHLTPRIVGAARTRPAPPPRARARTLQDATSVGKAPQEGFRDRIRLLEDALIAEALAAESGDRAAAARRLDMPLRTLTDRANALGASLSASPEAREMVSDLQRRVRDLNGLSFKERIERYELSLIDEALSKAGGNKTLAARNLRMPLATLKFKLRKLEAP